MSSQIPPNVDSAANSFSTRNSKEAALLYAVQEVRPVMCADGNPKAFRVKDPKTGKEIVYFDFETGRLAQIVHSAFTVPGWADDNAGTLDEAQFRIALSLIVQMWHNWERLKEATKSIPLHTITKKDGKIYIGYK